MKSETKVRTHRRLDRTETSITTDFETTKESERETQSTERFSIEKESTNVINQQMQIDSGVNVSGTYGVTKVDASLGFAYGVSSSQSNTEATSFSKDITNRALTRVKERTRTLKTVTVIHETEDTNEHTFDNTDTNGDHINGVYRWLDKIYLNKIFNYGARMMMEFTIAEPASFYIFRKLVSANAQNSVPKPIHPSELESAGTDYINIKSFGDITEQNYALLAAYYGVQGLESPPDEYVLVNAAFKDQGGTSSASGDFNIKEDIVIPENYVAEKAEFYFTVHSQGNPGSGSLAGWIGNHRIDLSGYDYGSPNPIDLRFADPGFVEFPTGTLSIAFKGHGLNYVIAIYVLCHRRNELVDAWRIKIFDKIMEAYNLQLSEYNNWMRQQSYNLQIEGNNPSINRQIEREELKKRAIELISGQRFESFDAAVNGIQNTSGYPEILFDESRKEGIIAKYFEQVFEWENMTYIFYPYFYGRKNNWLTINTLKDDDPIFEKFLKAGYARVIVPVRPGFEKYTTPGCGLAYWIADLDPQYIPGVDAPGYISIATELEAAADIIEDDEDSVIGHYLQRVPTNLVYLAPLSLQPGDSAPGLPDNSGDDLISGWL